MSDEKSTLERVEEGARWLAELDSDPPGRFYLWFVSGIRPGQPHGAHVSEATKEGYAKYHKGLSAWKRLYARLEAESSQV